MEAGGFFLTLLGGQDFEEWYDVADLVLAVRGGLTLDGLKRLAEWQFRAVVETVWEHQPKVNEMLPRCPFGAR